MAESVDYAVVLADLKARRARLDQLIAGIEATILGGGGDVPVDLEAGSSGPILPTTIHPDTFFGMSIIEAAKKFLKIARRAQHTTAIAEALSQGGQKRPTDAVLSSILVRAAKGREITKVGKGMWGLPEFYPKAKEPVEDKKLPGSHRRTQTKKSATKRPEAKKPETKTAPKAKAAATATAKNPNGARPSDLAVEFIRATTKPFHTMDVTKYVNGKGVGASRTTIESFLHRQAKAGKLQKTGPSTYASPMAAAS
jgi:hypothetical protein